MDTYRQPPSTHYTYTGVPGGGPGRGTGGGGGGVAGKFGSSDRCPKCGGAVYMAEKIVGAGSVRYLNNILPHTL